MVSDEDAILIDDESVEAVLILVLMEYGLGQGLNIPANREGGCLNPCFNGIWSRTMSKPLSNQPMTQCLNPCFNGIWSRTDKVSLLHQQLPTRVLILVLMEYGLGLRL